MDIFLFETFEMQNFKIMRQLLFYFLIQVELF